MEAPTVAPTLLERFLLAFAYLFTAGIGASVFFWPPAAAVTSALGGALSVVWALFIMSSLACVPAAIAGRYRVEFALIPFFTTALIVAVAATWIVAFTDPLAIPRACTATALILTFALRYIRLLHLIANGKALARGRLLWTKK